MLQPSRGRKICILTFYGSGPKPEPAPDPDRVRTGRTGLNASLRERGADQSMNFIRRGATVKIHYRLTIDGEVVDSTEGAEPVVYRHGQGQLVPGLEERLEGCAEGEKLKLVVPPEKAYGPYVPEDLHEISRSAFTDPSSTRVGTLVEGRTRLGAPFRARVIEEKDDSFVIDLNHPLAGKYLEFEVEIVAVSAPEADEGDRSDAPIA